MFKYFLPHLEWGGFNEHSGAIELFEESGKGTALRRKLVAATTKALSARVDGFTEDVTLGDFSIPEARRAAWTSLIVLAYKSGDRFMAMRKLHEARERNVELTIQVYNCLLAEVARAKRGRGVSLKTISPCIYTFFSLSDLREEPTLLEDIEVYTFTDIGMDSGRGSDRSGRGQVQTSRTRELSSHGALFHDECQLFLLCLSLRHLCFCSKPSNTSRLCFSIVIASFRSSFNLLSSHLSHSHLLSHMPLPAEVAYLHLTASCPYPRVSQFLALICSFYCTSVLFTKPVLPC